jgi:hypothetical protein
MNRLGPWIAGICSVVGAAACTGGSTAGRPPPLSDPIPSDSGSVAVVDDGSVGDGGPADTNGRDAFSGSATDAEDDGAIVSGDGAAVQVQPGSDAAMAEPVCSLTTTWSTPSSVPGLPAFPTQPLVTMTSDELTVAWVLDTGNGGSVFVADRSSPDVPFGSPNALATVTGNDLTTGDAASAPAPDGGQTGASSLAFDRVGLRADGLTLMGVTASAAQMVQYIRNQRGSAFSSLALPTRYESLGNVLMAGEHLGDPVLSADGDDLVYSRYGLSPTVSIYESFQNGTNPWPPGSQQLGAPLAMTQGARMRPTCLSVDRLTLFFWDDVTNTAYGVFRNGVMDQFTSSAKAYGSFFSVQANARCSRLYYVETVSTGFMLVQVDAQ